MNSFYDMELVRVTSQLTLETFEQGWVAREKAVGSLRDSRFFTGLFAVLGVMFLIVKIPELARFHWENAIVGLLEFLMCMVCVVYQQIVLPQRVWSDADALYRSNRVLQSRETICLTRDGFTIENPYEQITGYWSETACCAESAQYFVFCGGLDRETIILPKNTMTDEQIARVSEKMHEVFAGRFRTVK